MSARLLGIATQIMVMAILVSVVLLFIGIGVLVLIHVCIVGRAFRRGLATNVRVERANDVRNGLSEDDLENIPCYDYKAGEKGTSPVECAICLECFQFDDRCRLLPVCKHSFHAHCVDSWLLKTPLCPICRTSADHRKGSVISEEQESHIGGILIEMGEGHLVLSDLPANADQSSSHASSSA